MHAEFVLSDRGAGYFFGEEPCKRFLLDNGFVAMVRGHEVVAKGARVHFGCCWTVFSHPRYMGLRNVAATLVITDGANLPRCWLDVMMHRPVITTVSLADREILNFRV